MALVFTATSLFRNVKPGIVSVVFFSPNSVRNYAARKGTRERKQKLQKKVVVEKLAWSPERAQLAKKAHLLKKITRTVEKNELSPVDDVYFESKFITRAMSIAEAVRCHRENFHPTMLNLPEAPIDLSVELDLTDGKKGTIKNFKLLANIPHPWVDFSTKNILAFCKTPETQKIALDKGADTVGGVELIKKIQKGEFSLTGFDFILCHDNIYIELSSIRGLMKLKYPTRANGTVGPDIAAIVHKFKHGLEINCSANQFHPDLAVIKAPIGSLRLTDSQIEENFVSIIETLMKKCPVKDDPFITWVWCKSPLSHEQFKIDIESYIKIIGKPEAPKKKPKRT